MVFACEEIVQASGKVVGTHSKASDLTSTAAASVTPPCRHWCYGM